MAIGVRVSAGWRGAGLLLRQTPRGTACAAGTDRWVGLIARYRDDGNYHYVTLRNSGSLDIKKLVNGTIQNLVTVPFPVQPDVSYRVRLEAIGTRVRAYVNGTLRAEATDASLTPVASRAGVATYKAALDLDNFLISQP